MKSGEIDSLKAKAVENALLNQIGTFGMTTRLVWGRTPQLQMFSTNEITRSLRSLTRRGELEAHPLHHGRFYFTFPTASAIKIENDFVQGGAYSERDKFKAFAKLLVGTFHLEGARPLSRSTLHSILSEESRGLPSQFMADSELKHLYSLRIDSSIRAWPSRTAQQLRNDVFRFVKISTLKKLIQSNQFELVLVTCTERRSEAILNHFRFYDRVGGTPIRSIVIPELIPLVTSVPIGGAIQPNTK